MRVVITIFTRVIKSVEKTMTAFVIALKTLTASLAALKTVKALTLSRPFLQSPIVIAFVKTELLKTSSSVTTKSVLKYVWTPVRVVMTMQKHVKGGVEKILTALITALTSASSVVMTNVLVSVETTKIALTSAKTTVKALILSRPFLRSPIVVQFVKRNVTGKSVLPNVLKTVRVVMSIPTLVIKSVDMMLTA